MHSNQSPRRQPPPLQALVRGASLGDEAAWQALVARFDRSLRAIARSYRLCPSDIDDVVQATWSQLYVNVDRVRDAGAIGGWLATATRREALRTLHRRAREQPIDDPALGDGLWLGAGERPENAALAAERRTVLRDAVAALPSRQRRLLTMLIDEPDVSYREISTRLQMPVGSVGPIRARGLARLKCDGGLRALCLDLP